MSAETVHLKAQLPQTPPPELVHDPLKAKSTVHGSLIREPMPLMGSLNHFKPISRTNCKRNFATVWGNSPKENYLHIHPLNNFNDDLDKNLNVITSYQARPAEDIFRNSAERHLGARGGWHADIGYEPHSADYTVLKLTQLPESGGDTLWASSCEIYDKISPAYRSFLETLTATFEQPRYFQTCKEKGFELYTDSRGSPANVGTSLKAHHPVVRTNPVTGWKSLLGVGNHCQKIDDLTAEESRRLHDWFLQMIVETPDVQCRFRWNNPYDTAIWDNRTLFHTANLDYAGCGLRTGHRAVGIGEEAYFDPASSTRREALDAEKRAKGEVFDGKNRGPENLLAME
ncbi:alpha-ketoglutarate-dependent sulfonate [Lasallia pustulata]|uniref:Alpha-ketoglutarate-dependent sulfonate n=1 Tax=Lasallia pustulata TaxID=136370 RepID=A0A1W5D3R9_9LECA|nr:alpha-ketoglutarate-dependent sulfonate [Lasallia pustulata]